MPFLFLGNRKDAKMKILYGVVALSAVTMAVTGLSLGGDKVTVGRNWPQGQLVSIEQIGHSPWDLLLRKYVDRQGMVNYTAWKASRGDLQALDAYLAALSRANPDQPASREAKLAFWINAYNAVTIQGILREYPTRSIRNHTAKVVGYNIWDDLLLPVGGRQYSLNQMEHDILRKAGEPRIHFAVVCASIGCPRLLNQAYTSAQLDAQLTSNTQHFFADRAKFNYDGQSRRINISPILKWFAEDFGASQAQQLATIAPYLPDGGARRLATSGTATVSYLSYDWDLNEQATARIARRR